MRWKTSQNNTIINKDSWGCINEATSETPRQHQTGNTWFMSQWSLKNYFIFMKSFLHIQYFKNDKITITTVTERFWVHVTDSLRSHLKMTLAPPAWLNQVGQTERATSIYVTVYLKNQLWEMKLAHNAGHRRHCKRTKNNTALSTLRVLKYAWEEKKGLVWIQEYIHHIWFERGELQL